jgi:hypothetical protein
MRSHVWPCAVSPITVTWNADVRVRLRVARAESIPLSVLWFPFRQTTPKGWAELPEGVHSGLVYQLDTASMAWLDALLREEPHTRTATS